MQLKCCLNEFQAIHVMENSDSIEKTNTANVLKKLGTRHLSWLLPSIAAILLP